MEKRADVRPGQTPPERKNQPVEKLDEDTSKRLSDKWAKKTAANRKQPGTK